MGTLTKSRLACQIEAFEAKTSLVFRPQKAFYTERVRINRIRFWQIVRGSKDPTSKEVERLAAYFGLPAEAFIEATGDEQSSGWGMQLQ